METIRVYIENLFRNYPDSPKVRKAKEELLGIMEDKYHELKSQGRSENEAIGVVISEFGNMEEIAGELEMEDEFNRKKESSEGWEKNKVETCFLDMAQAKEYMLGQISFGRYIAFGVALCILSPFVACILEALAEGGLLPYRLAELVGGLTLFLLVAVAVGIFVVKGIANDSATKKIKDKKILLDNDTKAYVEAEQEKFMQKFGITIAAGVGCCVLSVVPGIVMEAVVSGTRLFWLEDFAGAILFVLVAIGVACFITAGTQKDVYDTLLGIKKVPANAKKQSKVMEMVSSVYWLFITAIYLAVSFLTGSWGISWVIWPIAGVIFGIVAVIIRGVMGEE